MKVVKSKRIGDARTMKRNTRKAVRQQDEHEARQALAEREHDDALERQEAFVEAVREMSVPAEPVTHPAGWFPQCGRLWFTSE